MSVYNNCYDTHRGHRYKLMGYHSVRQTQIQPKNATYFVIKAIKIIKSISSSLSVDSTSSLIYRYYVSFAVKNICKYSDTS